MTETQVWGLKHPENYAEDVEYREDLIGFITDLEELGFKFHLVTSYHKLVLVIGNRGDNR